MPRLEASQRSTALVLAVCLTALVSLPAAAQTGVFPFRMSYDDVAEATVDLSSMNHKPAGSLGRITVGPDGHLYAGGQRQRFLGMNLVARTAFPDHQTAAKVARHLARFGVNVVRLHLLDAYDRDNVLIFDQSHGNTRHLNEASLEKLDYIVAQLKSNGIYINFNLLTWRWFTAADGLDAAIASLSMKEQQTPALFDPPMIALQKEYAGLLLGHINPYTGLAYREDPAVAFVETINEHGLMHAWHSGLVDSLPEFFAGELRAAWNQHLLARYGSDGAWKAAWGNGTPPGTQMLTNPDFAAGFQGWTLEVHPDVAATITVTSEGPSGKPAARLQVTAPCTTPGTTWKVQVNQVVSVDKAKGYTLRFWARADRPKVASVSIEQAHDPWGGLGFWQPLSLTTSWQQFEFELALLLSDDRARLNFRDFCDEAGTYWLADLSLTTTGTSGVVPGESVEDGTITLVPKTAALQRAVTVLADWSRFLFSTDEAYFDGMRTFLKDNLSVQALLVGTIVGCSTPNLMAAFDVVDAHQYWQHPRFEGAPFESPWCIRNTSMVTQEDGGTLSTLSLKRVHGKPFTVSEYSHPAPNSFSVEALPLLAAYAALQDWDAIYVYDFMGTEGYTAADSVTQFMDCYHDPGRMMSLMTAAQVFRRGDVAAAQQLVTVPLTRDDEIRLLPTADAWRLVDAEHVGMPHTMGMLHRIAMVAGNEATPPNALPPSSVTVPTDGRFTSDTGELSWMANWSPTEGLMLLETPRSVGVVGFGADTTHAFGGVKLRPGRGLQGWASLFLTSLDGQALAKGSTRMLLLAHGLVRNHGWTVFIYPGRTPAGFPPPAGVDITLDDWGTGPVEVEGIPCQVELQRVAENVQVFALDEVGKRKAQVPVIPGPTGLATFDIGPQYRTLWYEIVVEAPRARRHLRH